MIYTNILHFYERLLWLPLHFYERLLLFSYTFMNDFCGFYYTFMNDFCWECYIFMNDFLSYNKIRGEIFTTICDNYNRQLFLSRHTARTICSFALLIQPYDNSKISFVIALMKCSKAAFGEQNKKCFYSVLGILHAVGGG